MASDLIRSDHALVLPTCRLDLHIDTRNDDFIRASEHRRGNWGGERAINNGAPYQWGLCFVGNLIKVTSPIDLPTSKLVFLPEVELFAVNSRDIVYKENKSSKKSSDHYKIRAYGVAQVLLVAMDT